MLQSLQTDVPSEFYGDPAIGGPQVLNQMQKLQHKCQIYNETNPIQLTWILFENS